MRVPRHSTVGARLRQLLFMDAFIAIVLLKAWYVQSDYKQKTASVIGPHLSSWIRANLSINHSQEHGRNAKCGINENLVSSEKAYLSWETVWIGEISDFVLKFSSPYRLRHRWESRAVALKQERLSSFQS